MEQQSGVQSLERAFALLEALSMQPNGAGLMELAQATGLHKSTAHRLLGALCVLGYVERVDAAKYRLTYKMLELSGRLMEGSDVMGSAHGVLDALRDRVGETVYMVVREGAQIVYVYKAECLWLPYRMASHVGARRDMHCTAAGKAILATMTEAEVREIWRQTDVVPFTPYTITSLDVLLHELDAVRQKGYAVDDQENELDVRCIAGAICDHGGRCTGAFSVSAPLTRMGNERIAELAGEVLRVRRQLGGYEQR